MGDLDKRALDRWITREPENEEEAEQQVADMDKADDAYEASLQAIRNNNEWQTPVYFLMKAGDKIRYRGKIGTLASDARFVDKAKSDGGLYYADVQWEGATLVRNYKLPQQGLEWMPQQGDQV